MDIVQVKTTLKVAFMQQKVRIPSLSQPRLKYQYLQDIKKFKGRIHDLDSENSQKGNEITDLMGMLEQYDEDIKKYVSSH